MGYSLRGRRIKSSSTPKTLERLKTIKSMMNLKTKMKTNLRVNKLNCLHPQKQPIQSFSHPVLNLQLKMKVKMKKYSNMAEVIAKEWKKVLIK